VVIVGGADELNRVPLAGFNSLGVCGTVPCSPFDAERRGLNLGEGAGIMVLEADGHAARRGAAGLVEVSGYGAAADGYHITAPRPDGAGLKSAIDGALRVAGISAAEVDFINAHGTGTDSNDRCEGQVLAELFGSGVRYLSTKRFTGHTLGAAGALELIFTAVMLRRGVVPPSAGFSGLPEDIPFPPLTETFTGSFSNALSVSLAFGGCNSAVVLRNGGSR
jgi:3-oxoacyl-(acyl-carrier-protein) synthase